MIKATLHGNTVLPPKAIIYGNGSMAEVVYSYVRRELDVCAFTVDDSLLGKDTVFCQLPLIPFSSAHAVYDPAIYVMFIAVGFLDMNAIREEKSREAQEKGYSLASYIHDSAVLGDNVSIEENCIVLNHVTLASGVCIRRGVFISSNVSVGHACDVGEYAWLNSGVVLAGDCKVGRGSFFGVNSSAAHGIRIGERNFVAANTLINTSTSDDEVYVSPAGSKFCMGSKAFLRIRRVLD